MWEYYSGKTLDSTQRLTVEVMMATAGNRWAAATTGREMPRQNGKGDEIEVVEFWGLVQRAEAILHTVHDAVLLTAQAQQRMLSVLFGKTDLRSRKKRVHVGTGQQLIELKNGGTIWYRTRSGGGGRGVDDVDRLVVDEAQHATEEHLAAVSPTLLVNDNPQLNAMGTSALSGKSDWWWTIRRRALIENPGAFGYVGHTAENVSLNDKGRIVQAEVDVNDRRLWAIANPALTRRPDLLGFLEEQLLRMGPESFAREHLGVWDPPPDGEGSETIPSDRWAACLDPLSRIDGDRVFAVEVAKDRDWAAIGVAGRSGPFIHGEVVEYDRGTEWVPQRCLELTTKWRGKVGVVRGTPAAALVKDLEKLGVPFKEITAEEYQRQCAQLLDSVKAATFRHIGQAELDVAVNNAVPKDVGDGAFAFDRKRSAIDITPLTAVTVAAGLFGAGPPPVDVLAQIFVGDDDDEDDWED